MQDFKKLHVWTKAMTATRQSYEATRSFPSDERFGLQAQMRRAAVSMPSNIAEGCGRRSQGDLVRFLRIAYGSSCELETQALLSLDLGYAEDAQLRSLLTSIDELQRMLTALIDRIQQSP